MSEPAEVTLARIREKEAARKRRYRSTVPPEKKAEEQRVRHLATAALRDAFRSEYEYEIARARARIPGEARQAHYRAAMARLRASHPTEWRAALDHARSRSQP